MIGPLIGILLTVALGVALWLDVLARERRK
jgi:hypothetical protein